MNRKLLLCFSFALSIWMSSTAWAENTTERIPFYEDYIESGDLESYIRKANEFLDANSASPMAPRIALDLLMMGKAAENVDAVIRGTDLLLFDYLGSLPSLHFFSTFDPGSKRLSELLKVKAEEGDLSSVEFAQSYADAITLIARIQGPQVLADSELRIRSYLITALSDNQKLNQSIREAVEQLVEQKDKLAPLAKIILGDGGPIEKLRSLGGVSLNEAEFCRNYYISQISESERSSPEIDQLLIELKLFSSTPQPKEAIEMIESLDQGLLQTSKISLFHAVALILDGKEGDAMEKIKVLLKEHSAENDAWADTAKSMANGLEFADSRINLLLDQLEVFYKRSNEKSDSIKIEAIWNIDRNGTVIPLHILLGASASSESFEIQVSRNEKPYFSYRTDNNSSSLLTPDKTLHIFAEKGPYPVPLMDISRDSSLGTFNYNFNLNFGREFSDFTKPVLDILTNSYISTSKGREVLINYLIERKGLWISPPDSLENGTRFKLNSINPASPSPKASEIEIDLAGNLSMLKIGNLRIVQCERGEPEILSSMPSWPEVDTSLNHDSFQFSILMESIGSLMTK
jgi:hypothetical protein